jgi:zinc D-Ala-D-Ala carboxypeptidase
MDDQKLSEHFSLYELTTTTHPEFQEQNRILTDLDVDKLMKVAALLEMIRAELQTPLFVHSGYRCLDLNRAVGSSDRSQHLLCEAADFVPQEQDLGDCFRKIWRLVKDNKLEIGQLIHETAERSYGATSWIHVSLGEPYREKDRCNQILRMQEGVYTLLTGTPA